MEHEHKEPNPEGPELSFTTVRDPEDIKSAIEGEYAAMLNSDEMIAKLRKEGKYAEARAEDDLKDLEFVKHRVLDEHATSTLEEITEAFRQRNETFKDKLALFLEPVRHYEPDGREIDHDSLMELNSTRKYLELVWTELETLKWLAGNNNARIELRFQSGAGHVADTGREMPPDMQ